MPHDFCEPARVIRQEVHRVSRERMAAILSAAAADRPRLVAAAVDELLEIRAAGELRLPVGGCGGALCLTPYVENRVRALTRLGESTLALKGGS